VERPDSGRFAQDERQERAVRDMTLAQGRVVGEWWICVVIDDESKCEVSPFNEAFANEVFDSCRDEIADLCVS
jgi:hypothetical protein